MGVRYTSLSMGSVFGRIFRVSTWGESHGGSVGCVVEGVPPDMALSEADIQPWLDRRRPGQSKLTTQRQEKDLCRITSGVFEGRTLGTPVHIEVDNEDQKSSAYADFKHLYRPSHADYTYQAKYGIRAWAGGGRASARETIGRVAAGAVAFKALGLWFPLEIVAWVESIGDLVTPEQDELSIGHEAIEAHPTRCPDLEMAQRMEKAIEGARKDGDSLGGVVRCVVRGVPPGLGDPVFDKLEADLAKAMMSLPATKGFEIGSGFGGTKLRGSQHNDAFYMQEGRVRTRTNLSGGIQGGISNGEHIVFRVAFKPTATILRDQETVTDSGEAATIAAKGRHDPYVVIRAPVLVESMAAMVLMDAVLLQRAIRP